MYFIKFSQGEINVSGQTEVWQFTVQRGVRFERKVFRFRLQVQVQIDRPRRLPRIRAEQERICRVSFDVKI